MRITLLLFCIFAVSFTAFSQTTQTVSGRITEQYTSQPVPAAQITLLGTSLHAVADSNGYFVLPQVPVGRVDVRIAAMSYQTAHFPNLEVVTGKQLQLNVELKEDVTYLNEVKVVADQTQFSLNEMTQASRRTFSIEESKRYAGSLNDVQRMASSFAGVSTANDEVNDLIVRGNMPSGMLFRLDGLNIPNPNHWSMPGSAGGTVSMLNNNVLRNSDFLTGAFAAEYDAFSGVFDLKTRNGNHLKHEHLFQIGFNGLELGAEGPLKRSSRASYLVNYRKSLLQLLSSIVPLGRDAAVPRYQDFFLKVNAPTRKAGTFSLIAMGGTSTIHFKADEEKKVDYRYDDLKSGSNTGVIGLTHQYSPTNRLSLRSAVMASGVLSTTTIDSVWLNRQQVIQSEPFVRNRFKDTKLGLHHQANLKVNAQHQLKAGAYVDYIIGDYTQDVFRREYTQVPKTWQRGIAYADGYMQAHVYANHLYRLSPKIELVTGLAYKYQNLTNKHILEPKLSGTIKTGTKGAFSFGTGLYSKAPSLIHANVAELTYNVDGEVIAAQRHNQSLDYMKSIHSVVGYDWFITPKLHIKTELYHQHLYDVITAKEATAAVSEENVYSALNEFSFSFEQLPARLANRGLGQNYGIELTVEQFLNKGFYFLGTTSVFNSRYRSVDQQWRNTRFNSNLVVNTLAGKEWVINPTFKVLVDIKANYMKGNRYIPLKPDASVAMNEAVYDYGNAYTQHLPDFFRIDFRIGYKIITKRVTQEIAFEAQNVTNRRNVFAQQYNTNTRQSETLYQNGILPMGLYRIYF